MTVADPAATEASIYAKMYAQETQDLPILYLWFQKSIVGTARRRCRGLPTGAGWVDSTAGRQSRQVGCAVISGAGCCR